MMKKISILLLAFALCFAFPLAAAADALVPRLVDDANLLSEDEYQNVLSALDAVSEKYGVDVAVLTADGLGGKDIISFADDYYEEMGYGTGTDHSGVLLVLDMDSRQWYFTTEGEGIKAFTDYGIDVCGETIAQYLSSGNFEEAFLQFAAIADSYFEQERAGKPFDNYQPEEEPEGGYQPEQQRSTSVGSYVLAAVVSLAAGLGLSFAVTAPMKSKLKSVRKQTSAAAYTNAAGFQLTENSDRYLYHRVVAVPIPRTNSNSSGRGGFGGGSSVHHSSSGRIHGGGGGRF